MRAISALSFDAGTSIFGSLARTPFRMRVSMSAMGSVMFIAIPLRLLPARLDHARDLASEGELPEADPAQLELANVGAGPTAQLAPGVRAHRELRLALGLGDHGQLGQLPYLLTGSGTACRGTRGAASTPRPSGQWSRRSRSCPAASRPSRSRSRGR